ncbi:MAG: hypothetical protein CSB47_10320 [Proteobacteria bacterium]|nr:MAG: hypothetical protein CSB47_10320 [Pseudomonadota bacterium]
MRGVSVLCKIAALFVFSSLLSVAFARGYNLNCLAGGHMGLTYNASTRSVTVSFIPATVGTRDRALSHGQCGWVDRGMRGHEPRKICHYNVTDVVAKNNARSYEISSRQAPYMRKIKYGGHFSLRVVNYQNKCMRVLRVNRFDRALTIGNN